MESVINFNRLEKNVDDLSSCFRNAKPFEYVVIDGFCDENSLSIALNNIPNAEVAGINKSRDFIFAKNKFEKSKFEELSPEFSQLKADFVSERFAGFLEKLTGQKIFLDPEFHGGGLHQGGAGSFLDMHADFNYHPINKNWFRNVNILLYMNKGWKAEYKGELQLRDGREIKGRTYEVEPFFNRAVIMYTRDYTLHGYQPIAFPKGTYRRSIAAYGYSYKEQTESLRTTVWYPEEGGYVKQLLGRYMPALVKIKSKLFGSGTGRNK